LKSKFSDTGLSTAWSSESNTNEWGAWTWKVMVTKYDNPDARIWISKEEKDKALNAIAGSLSINWWMR